MILISDIFGRTPALEKMGQALSKHAADWDIVDPYGGADPGFETQDQAYGYFMTHAGLDKYLEILKKRLIRDPGNIIPVGFSVGAAVLWRASADPRFSSIEKGFCFYGSQIRQYTDIQPLFELELIFPRMEPHFDVLELMRLLSKKKRVRCSRADGLHGFMNKRSPGFDRACCDVYISRLRRIAAGA